MAKGVKKNQDIKRGEEESRNYFNLCLFQPLELFSKFALQAFQFFLWLILWQWNKLYQEDMEYYLSITTDHNLYKFIDTNIHLLISHG